MRMLLFTRVFTKKMKNKCLQLFLVLLCLMSVFGLAKEVKAEVMMATSSVFGSINASACSYYQGFEVPADCENNLLILDIWGYDDGYDFINASYNGDAMADLGYGKKNGLYPNARHRAYYLQNADIGTHDISFYNTRGQYCDSAAAVATVYCGVDQTTPIAFNQFSTSWASSGFSTSAFDVENDGSLGRLVLYTDGSKSVSGFHPSTATTTIDSGISRGYYKAYEDNIDTSTGNYFSGTITSSNFSFSFIVINPSAPVAYCDDGICNGEENTLTCPEDCPPSNGYSNIITLLYNPTEHPLIPDALDAFYFSYNTSLISNTYFGGLAYIEIERCLNVGCSTTTPYFFTDYTGATSTKSYILSKTITIASSTNTVGRSLFTIANESWRISSSTREVYKITPTYFNIGTSEMTTGNPTAQAVNWVAYDEQPPLPECVDKVFDGSTVCDIYDLEALTGQILCGFTYGTGQTLFWLFNPSCSSLDYIISGYNNFKGAFPFNAYYDLVDALDVAINSVATSSTSTIGIPFIDKDATSSNKFYILPVISSSSIDNAIGTENANVFRTTIGYLIWIIVAWIVYLIISKL